MLKHLCRTSYVRDNSRELLVRVVCKHKLDSGVVSAFKLCEVFAVGIAPHLSATVVVADSAAKSYCRASETASVRALGSVRPRFACCLCNTLNKELSCLFIANDICGIIVYKRNVVYVSGFKCVQRFGKACKAVRSLRVTNSRMAVNRADDKLVLIKAAIVGKIRSYRL